MVRFKNRFIVAQLVWRRKASGNLTPQTLVAQIRDAMTKHFGDYGMGKTLQSLQCKCYDPLTNIAILRIDRPNTVMLRCVLTFMTQISGLDVTIVSRRVCGSLRTVCHHALLIAEDVIRRLGMEESEQSGRISQELTAILHRG